MTTLNLSNAEADFLRECLNKYELELITKIKDLTELVAFCKTLNDDCVTKLKKDGEKLSNDLVLCKSVYFDLITVY